MVYEYAQLIPVLFGAGTVAQLGERVKASGCKKALFVYDGALKSAGLTDKAEKILKESGVDYCVFDNIAVDAPGDNINEGGEFARKNNADAVIALGGGSCIDTAKGIAALLDYTPPIEQYLMSPPMKMKLSVPVFFLPTTSGTGSEVTPISVIGHKKLNAKIAIFLEFKPGSMAIVDPELTVTAPATVTAYAGLDAFSHAVEAITAKDRNPRSEVLGAASLKLINNHLPTVCADGKNIEARTKMALASNWAGIAFADTNVQYGHALSDVLAAQKHTPHGLNCAYTTPEMIIFVAKDLPCEVRVIAKALGVPADEKTDITEVAEKTAEAARALMRKAGIKKMSEMGFNREELVGGAQIAFDSPLRYNCPIPVTVEKTAEILANMFDNY